MARLETYVGVIHGRPGPVTVVEQVTTEHGWVDQGVTVQQMRTVYRFSNGVAIRKQVEQDLAPSELACAECWITYDVMASPLLPVRPARKRFENACREAFWMKYHLA
ncbi:hypothetical protein FAZ21_03325 [Chitiniphilus eburneus]|uniref:Uncharacterized protein n=1 Tax=Chitiniphilus eburneus TaxID=2571148 RepID=A0A4U0QNH9_9NEIS|nr:hypothetical protein FAZ21_03325 [Chitiniphilus eburneus]